MNITKEDCANATLAILNYMRNGHANTTHDIIVMSDSLKRFIEAGGDITKDFVDAEFKKPITLSQEDMSG